MTDQLEIKHLNERLTHVERILERMAVQNEEESRRRDEESRHRDEWQRQEEEAHRRFRMELDAQAAETRAIAALHRELDQKFNMLIEAQMRTDALVAALSIRVDETSANVDKLVATIGNMLRGQV